MVSARSAAIAAASLATLVHAELRVLTPGGSNQWWVAQSSNVLIWSCGEAASNQAQFTVQVTNKDPTVLSGPIAIIATQNNFDCSKEITQQQITQPAATGYTVQLVNMLNSTDIYAESEEFEIKPLGSAYPATSASVSASATGSAQQGAVTGSSDSGSNGAVSTTRASGGVGLGAIMAVLGFFAA